MTPLSRELPPKNNLTSLQWHFPIKDTRLPPRILILSQPLSLLSLHLRFLLPKVVLVLLETDSLTRNIHHRLILKKSQGQ